MSLKNWSVNPSLNYSAPPYGAPEGMTLASVNNVMRQMMADTRQLAAMDTIASESTTDLGSKDATFLTVTGTTTIASFGTVSAGIYKVLTFKDSLTLTHNATSLILPGDANITTASGDTAIFLSLGSGNWRCVNYQYHNKDTASNKIEIEYVTTSDFNDLTQTGFYKGYFTNNSPLPFPMSWYVDVKDLAYYSTPGEQHILQIAVAASEGTHDGRVCVRFYHNGIWFPWSELVGTEIPDYVAPVNIINLSGYKSIFIDVIGNGTLSDFGSSALPGTFKFLTFTGTVTLVHNASSLVLPTSANIITAQGDTALFVHTGSGVWKCIAYVSATLNSQVYACRAWVNFDGTATGDMRRASGNVSSITDNGTGDYTINFTTAMPDANYSVSGIIGWEGYVNNTGAWAIKTQASYMSTSSVRIRTIQVTDLSSGFFDPDRVFIQIVR